MMLRSNLTKALSPKTPKPISRPNIRAMTSSSSSSSSSTSKFMFSEGENEDDIRSKAMTLVVNNEGGEGGQGGQGGKGGKGGRWNLTDDGKGLERWFRFKSFGATWDFMNAVAAECKVQKHHPEWSNVYNKTHIRWTTHKPLGLSSKDVHMARFCDDAGAQHGEIVEVVDADAKGSN